MIDHEFSTYFIFPENSAQHMYWYSELIRSIEGHEVQEYEYDCLKIQGTADDGKKCSVSA